MPFRVTVPSPANDYAHDCQNLESDNQNLCGRLERLDKKVDQLTALHDRAKVRINGLGNDVDKARKDHRIATENLVDINSQFKELLVENNTSRKTVQILEKQIAEIKLEGARGRRQILQGEAVWFKFVT